MKVYTITDPVKLMEAVAAMNCRKEADRVAAFCRSWVGLIKRKDLKADKTCARLEIGKSAQIFKMCCNHRVLLGTMNVAAARAYAEGLADEAT